jgi:uncharacterized protein (TIGR03435 family)
VYALVLATRDRRPADRLRPTTANCAARPAGDVGPMNADPSQPCGFLGPSVRLPNAGAAKMALRGLTMEGFARLLAPLVRRPVIDETGLEGDFDGDFEFTSEIGPPPPPPGTTDPLDRSALPSLFAVLPEQLGLRLQPRRAEVEIMTVADGHRPRAD